MQHHSHTRVSTTCSVTRPKEGISRLGESRNSSAMINDSDVKTYSSSTAN